TRRLREKLKAEVPPALSAALNSPLPKALLHSRVAQRSAQRLLWILDRVDAVGLVSKLRKLAEQQSPQGEPSGLQTNGPAPETSAAARAGTDKPMPEMIRTTGGKRVPAAVAQQAVAHSGVEFKPKKGKK
ncbi:MAG TPA: hypothetical protein VE549_04820, partial [Myxococcaceae bacterium]|nr:hypothetical protein [Myxococcaceae bacterium]